MTTSTAHSSGGLGVAAALAGQVNYVNSVNSMLTHMIGSIIPLLTQKVTDLSNDMNKVLENIKAGQTEFSTIMNGSWANNWNGKGLYGATGWAASIANTTIGAVKDLDGTSILFSGVQIDDLLKPVGLGKSLMDFWFTEPSTPYNNTSQYLNAYHQLYNTYQLSYQNQISTAQKPIDLWSNTINSINQTTTQDWTLCQTLTSIWKNLNNHTKH